MSKIFIKLAQIIFVGFFIIACEDASTSEIQKDLDTNPKLSRNGIKAKLAKSDNGYLTIMVWGLRKKATDAINKGEELEHISMLVTEDVLPLVEMEEILKKRVDVKGIQWKAY
jgi:hypothetical protein